MNTFIEQLNSVGKIFVDFAAPMLIQSSVLIVILLVLDLFLRKRIRAVFRYWIWMIVLIKLVLPPTLSLPTSPVYWIGNKIYNPVSNSQIPKETQTYSYAAYTETLPYHDIGAVEYSMEPTLYVEKYSADAIIQPEISLQGIAFLTWLAVSFIMFILLIQRTFFVKWLIKQSQIADWKLKNILEHASLQIGVKKKISLRLSDTALSPSVCGLFRPTILIPKKLVEKLSTSDLNSILLHEMAHIKRYDLWVSLIQAVLQIIYIYNPLLWLANIVIRNTREQAVDEIVLVAMGQQAEAYPKTLLNISRFSFGSPALSLRLIGVAESKKALFSRIKHITSNPFPTNTKLGVLGTLTIIVIASVLMPMARAKRLLEPDPEIDSSLYANLTNETPSPYELIRQAQTRKNEPDIPDQSTNSVQPEKYVEPVETVRDETRIGERILHFPKARSLGQLNIGDVGSVSDHPYPFDEIQWESFSNAQGDVKIPKGKIVQLILYSWTWQNPANLSVLKQLKPDDIYSLTLSPQWSIGGQSPNDKCLPYVLHLSGLKTLNIQEANITSKGLESLAGLKSLERLWLPANINDSKMVAVGKLKTLQVLRISEKNSITNIGLKQLENLKSLRILQIPSVNITDEGLDVLSELPNLNYLVLSGNFTDDAALYLKDVSSLRGIRIDMVQFGDSGMKNLAGLAQLENVDVYHVRGITDEGVKYLKNMPNLKSFITLRSQLTDESLSYLQECKKLETLSLPDSFSDTGLTYIGKLSSLRYLGISGYYTDKGIAEIAKCKLLETLILSSEGVTDESLRYISELKNLKSLTVMEAGISDEGIKHIAKLTNLRELNISGELLTNKAIAELAPLQSLIHFSIGGDTISVSGLKYLNNFKNLKSLNIRKIKQDDSDIMDISGLTKLEDLTLFLNVDMNYRDGSLSNIARFRDEDWACLANLRKLNRLQITGFGITDNGMKYLAALKNLEFINIQCLRELGITDEGIKYLADLSKLNRLMIMDGHFTDKSLEYLSNLPVLTSLQLTSDFAFSNKAIKNLQTKNPNIGNLQLIP